MPCRANPKSPQNNPIIRLRPTEGDAGNILLFLLLERKKKKEEKKHNGPLAYFVGNLALKPRAPLFIPGEFWRICCQDVALKHAMEEVRAWNLQREATVRFEQGQATYLFPRILGFH